MLSLEGMDKPWTMEPRITANKHNKRITSNGIKQTTTCTEQKVSNEMNKNQIAHTNGKPIT